MYKKEEERDVNKGEEERGEREERLDEKRR